MTNDDILLTDEEVAKIVKVQPKTVHDWGRAGRLPRVCLSARCVRYRLSDVKAFFAAHMTGGNNAETSHP